VIERKQRQEYCGTMGISVKLAHKFGRACTGIHRKEAKDQYRGQAYPALELWVNVGLIHEFE